MYTFEIRLHRYTAHGHKRNCWKLERKPTCGSANHSLRWGSTLHTWLVWIRSVHRGPTWLADKTTLQTPIPVSRLRVKQTHQNLNVTRAKWSVHTGSRLFVNHRLLSSLTLCNQTQKSKLLSCRYTLSTWTLPLTVLTVQSQKERFFSYCAVKSLTESHTAAMSFRYLWKKKNTTPIPASSIFLTPHPLDK